MEQTANIPAAEPKPKRKVSRVTSGKTLLHGAPMPTKQKYRWRDLYLDYRERAGAEHDELCRSLATMVVQREELDAAIARGERINTTDLVQLVRQIMWTLRALGLLDRTADEAAREKEQAERDMREAGLL